MEPSQAGIDLIKSFEGCRLSAYRDIAGIWTVGWGEISYKDGSAVKEGDTLTQQQADDLLAWQVGLKAEGVNALGLNLNQNQFDSLVSFAYNLGIKALANSTLARKIRANPNDTNIRMEFLKWIIAGGKKNSGLLKRRKTEADLYFTPVSA